MAALYEVELLPGLKELVQGEIRKKFKDAIKFSPAAREDQISLSYAGDARRLCMLRTAAAIYLVESFPVPRPRALLGDQAVKRLAGSIKQVIALNESGAFKSFRLSAAGKNSSVMKRIAAALSGATGLQRDDKNGSLLLRIRPAANAWEVLIRLTPRPLATRPWRVRDMPGALNATIAAAMLQLLPPAVRGHRYLNIMCGSGTLLIERALLDAKGNIFGGDISKKALRCCSDNLRAAKTSCSLVRIDANRLPFPRKSFDSLSADFPWGERIGRRVENKRLYRQVLGESARILKPGGRFVLISQEYKLLSALISENNLDWTCEQEVRVFQGGYHPHIFLLARKS